jgi:hypothetical protein
LGKLHTASGEAQLTEIDTTTHWGPIRILQSILLKDGRAYIVTAAAHKQDFCNFYRDFQEAFHSLTVTNDLFDTIPQLERRTSIRRDQEELIQNWKQIIMPFGSSSEEFFNCDDFQKNHWTPFQKKIEEGFEDMGCFWQILVLIHVRKTLESIPLS